MILESCRGSPSETISSHFRLSSEDMLLLEGHGTGVVSGST